MDSIRENGVLTNLTVRRRAEGGYEIISGHRRFHAAQRAGLNRVKVQVRDIDDDQAIIDMVDSNIQREHISPMEKARAYAMKWRLLVIKVSAEMQLPTKLVGSQKAHSLLANRLEIAEHKYDASSASTTLSPTCKRKSTTAV